MIATDCSTFVDCRMCNT